MARELTLSEEERNSLAHVQTDTFDPCRTWVTNLPAICQDRIQAR